MGADLSDPNWWPKPRRQQKAIPWPVLVFGTVIPGIAGIVIAIVLVGHMSTSTSSASSRSLAAYDLCLKARGVSPTDSAGPKQIAAFRACRDRLPSGTSVGGFGGSGAGTAGPAPSSAQEEFSQCMQSATAGLHLGRGRFGGGGGSSSAFRNAVAVCQGLAGDTGGTSIPPPAATTSTKPPVA